MAIRTIAMLFLVSLLLSFALCIGCGGEGEKPLPYGPPQVQFPEDEGAHPEMLIEWWYGNFSLADPEGKEYGAMVAYFNSGFRILSISDLEAQAFYSEVFNSTPDYAEGGLNLRWGTHDHWFRTDPDSLSYHLESYGTEISLNLSLNSSKPPLLVGGDGLLEWTQGSFYYYSLTRLQVEGQIELAGRVIDVSGIGWMDHQWMNSRITRGWDWFSVQLDNQAEIIFWQIVNPDGSVDSQDLTIMFPDNSVYHTQDITLERMDSWVSPETGNEYGVLWRVREEAHDLDLEIRARYPEQEIRGIFWEGGTTVSGYLDGEAVTGTGYAELIQFPTSTPEEAPHPSLELP
ncbi:hypothetical protein KAU37_00625 [Candidatus Bipolaricaulota bacterium]|nr:hypothetical protein [Candidatus Bipolaricaulota bacterium]